MRHRTALGASALIIGANLPDLDILAYFAGPAADLEWRRGWSHGVLAMAVFPFLLTGSLLLFHRVLRRRRQWGAPSVPAPRQLLLLSFIAIVSHPVLDLLNTYGVRLLMPLTKEWFYGDTLFIIDPWVWLVLAAGVYYSVRRERTKRAAVGRPASVALGLVTLYAAAMALSGRKAQRVATQEVIGQSAPRVLSAMAAPVPFNPFRRTVVIEEEAEYRVGTFNWTDTPHVDRAGVLSFPRGRPSHPAVAAAVETELARRFLVWARYPAFEVQKLGGDRFLVHVVDLRYAREPGERFGTVSIPVTLPATSQE